LTGEEADPLSTLRPFSAHIARSEELVRLDQVRSTLARRGVHVPQAALERALVTPVVNFDATQQKAMLIGSGDLLMKNPFAAADESSGKAKSSKGKGKAKKGGKKKK
jgi:exo-beta-1,3-glucanase (GH17 family)